MKKVVTKNIYLFAQRSPKFADKLDYYFLLQSGMRQYAFTRKFSTSCYDVLRTPVRMDAILYGRSRNPAFMKLVKYLKYITLYLMEYINP